MNAMAFLAFIGGTELIYILLIVLVLFGAKKLPKLARSMGSSVTQFKKGLADTDEEPKRIADVDGDASGTPNAD